jgi:two-component system sensor histidine kinase DegS
MAIEEQESTNPVERLAREAVAEYEQAQKELKEIEILIRQSGDEVTKLAQRNAQLTNKVRQMEINLETVPRKDIRDLYAAAGDAQMRLFMMRGQVEQLQARQQSLERYGALLHKVIEALGQETQAGAEHRTHAGGQQPSLIARVIQAQESERQQLARQMHDGPAQSLTNLILQAEIVERLFDTDAAQARTELAALKKAVNTTFQRVRGFIFELRPMMLDDLGLVPTLRRYIQEFRDKTGVPVTFTLAGKERRLNSYTEVTIFRVVQGLLANVQQHAHASKVTVSLNLQDTTATTMVEDDGSGFDVAQALAASQQHKPFGLTSLQNQVELLGGRMQIESNIGRGTRITFELPIEP